MPAVIGQHIDAYEIIAPNQIRQGQAVAVPMQRVGVPRTTISSWRALCTGPISR